LHKLVTEEGSERLSERALSKLIWRCRRGMLENDLFLEKFFQRFGDVLTNSQAAALYVLMDLSDNDLMDLLLSRKSLGEVELKALSAEHDQWQPPSLAEIDSVLKMLKIGT
jgi:antitoxin CptB